MDWLSDHLWVGWLGLAVGLSALELVSLDLFLIMLAGGAVALIGKRAMVLRELVHGMPGRVKIGGEEWTAEPYDEDDRIEVGEIVDVVQIKGATAYVLRAHKLGS